MPDLPEASVFGCGKISARRVGIVSSTCLVNAGLSTILMGALVQTFDKK